MFKAGDIDIYLELIPSDTPQLKPSYTLQLEEPYDRAVALHLTRRAARDEGLKVKYGVFLISHTTVVSRLDGRATQSPF